MKCPYCNSEMEEGTLWSRDYNMFVPNESHVPYITRKNIQKENAVMIAVLNGVRPVAYCCRKCKKVIIEYEGDNGLYSE